MFSISAEMPKCQTSGSRGGAGGWREAPGPGFHSGPQGAAREAERRRVAPSLLTFPPPV